MALATVKKINTSTPGSQEREVVKQFNALLTLLRAVFVELDADAGVSATDLTAAIDAGPKQIADESGTVITS